MIFRMLVLGRVAAPAAASSSSQLTLLQDHQAQQSGTSIVHNQIKCVCSTRFLANLRNLHALNQNGIKKLSSLQVAKKMETRQGSHRVATIEIAYTLDISEPPKQLEHWKLSIHALENGTGCL